MTCQAAVPRWLVRLAGVLAAVVLLMLAVQVQVAFAADEPTQIRSNLGQTPPALSWINLKDSRGISAWNYELSVDRGGLTSPGKFFWSAITESSWGVYRSLCVIALWFLDWVLSFGWVSTIAAPLLAVGQAMQQVVDELGLVPTLLTVTAFLAGLWMLRGRFTTAVWEVSTACLIAALATGVFAQPVELIAGDNGFIVKANQLGQELAAELATGDSEGKTPAQLRQAQTGQLVDTFIRQPTQIINFGQVIDGTKCETAYNDVVRKGPYGDKDNIRNKMAGCARPLGQYAANPSASMAMAAVVFAPAAFVILLMTVVLAGSVISAGCWAMYQSLKAIVTLVTGLLPGGGRGSLLLTVAETLIALLIIVFTSVFLGVFLLVIQALFAGASSDSLPQTFLIVDVLIVVGIFIYRRQRQQLKAASRRMAEWMSKRPGQAPATRLPDRQPLDLGQRAASVARLGVSVAQWRTQRRIANYRPDPSVIDNRQQTVLFFGRQAPTDDSSVIDGEVVPDGSPSRKPLRRQLPGGGDRLALPPGPSRPQLPPGSKGGSAGGDGTSIRTSAGNPKKGPAGALARVGGPLARAGASAALAYATGGSSQLFTAASRTRRGVSAARRAAVTMRLNSVRRTAAQGVDPFGTNRNPFLPDQDRAGH